MRRVLENPEMAKKLAVVKRMKINEIKVDLAGYFANVEGSYKALQERLFRAWYIKLKGVEGVPWIRGSDSDPVVLEPRDQ